MANDAEYRLLYLLKLAHLRLGGLVALALAPYGIDPRELAVLTSIAATAGAVPVSQQELAQQLGIDRTTMVGIVDGLEHKGLVGRKPHPADRRKNAVALTPAGREALRGGAAAVDEAERSFLAPLKDRDAQRLSQILHTLVQEPAT